jgi:tetratricopeptide (TPR) repeat protein
MAKRGRGDPWSLFRYKAFISYAHEDQAFAQWLEERMGAFTVPRDLQGMWTPVGPVPADLRPVFRDQTNLSASHDLSEELEARLAESANLVVVCSPAAANSRWVAREIEHFRALGRGDRIFSIIVDGAPRGEGGTNCFPAPFLADEPMAADAREPEHGGDGRDAAFIKLVAGMLRVDPADLGDRENAILAARARNARRLAAVFGGVALVGVVSAGFAFVEYARANRSIGVAQHTIDGVLQTLESDRMQEVWGFQRIEPELLDRLLQLQNDLGGERRRSAAVQSTLFLRRAGLARSRGDIEASLKLNEQAYRAIIPVALRQAATREQRTLALRATYRYYQALGDFSRSGDQERILKESEPILRSAIRAGNLDLQGRRWASMWLDDKRQLLDNRNDHRQALGASDEAMRIVRVAEHDSAIEARIDYALVLDNRAFTLRSLHRDEEARQASQQACGIYDALYARVPTHRELLRFRIYCTLDRAAARYDQRDRAGAMAAIQEAVELATPAARVNRGEAAFQAALATAQYRVGDVDLWLDNSPQASIASYEQSMRTWGELYRGNNIQIGDFDNLENTFNSYTIAMRALERQDATWKARNAETGLRTFNSFRRCGERLGATSSCGRIVMAAAREAADRLFEMGRGTELIEPLRVAERLSSQLETVQWNRQFSDTFAQSCAFRRDVGRALVLANRPREAIEPLRQAIAQCSVFMRQHDYDMYIRSAVLGAYEWLSRAERATDQAPAARRTLAACYGLYGANCYTEYAEMLEQGLGGPVDTATARQVRAQRAYTNLKRFTVPVHAPGAAVTFPFDVYIFERPPNFPYQGIDDQIRWLKVNRGLEVPPDVGQSFRRLEEIARENHVSFPDLAVYALDAAKADSARKRRN